MIASDAAPAPRPAPWLPAVLRLLAWPGYLLFFLMLFVPTAYTPLKAGLLAFTLFVLAARGLIRRRFPIHPMLAIVTAGYAALGLLFTARGALNGAPGAVRLSTVYVIWPLVYALLITGLAELDALQRVFRVLVFATIAIALYSLHYLLWELRWWPDSLYLELDQGQGFSLYRGFTEFNLYSISSLLFLVPFVATTLLFLPPREVPVRRAALWAAASLGLLTAVLTGRRALLVVLLAAPILGGALWLQLPILERRVSRRTVTRAALATGFLLVALFVYLDQFAGLTLGALVTMTASGFDFASDPIANMRARQLDVLLSGWLESPWLGSGHGAAAPGMIRASEMPWAYELSYAALLYHTGLVGFVAYAAGVGWIFWTGVRALRSGGSGHLLLLPVLVGAATFLIANATNPYLAKYDYLWVIFLPVAFINHWLLASPSRAIRDLPP